ncbi:MAG: type II toxin-antitoxin system RelE/ParE family toxin [Desulfobacteraceae bacterium]|nr:type II toxin-antitoxin system RelE/ParE family toxin [Desulfobacteraceae bacterium]
MGWQIELAGSADSTLAKLDPQIARRILAFLYQRVATLDNPRSIGAALKGPLGTFWKYRVGDHRIICDIRDSLLTILVLRIGNRRGVYR